MNVKKVVGLVIAAIFLVGLSSSVNYLHYKFIKTHVGEAVFSIFLENGMHGTGFLVKTKKGAKVIVTNQHVCVDSTTVRVNNDRLPVIFSDAASDICVIGTLNNDKYKDATPLDIVAGPLTDSIVTLGFPYKNPLTMSYGIITGQREVELVSGTILFGSVVSGSCPENAKVEQADPLGISGVCKISQRYITTTATVGSGNSGGPAVDITGSVVGVVTLMEKVTNRALLIPSKTVLDILNRL